MNFPNLDLTCLILAEKGLGSRIPGSHFFPDYEKKYRIFSIICISLCNTLHIKTSMHIRKSLKLKSATTVDFFTSGEKVCNSALQILLLWAFPGTYQKIGLLKFNKLYKYSRCLLTWIGISLCLIRFFFLMVPCPAETEVVCIFAFLHSQFPFDQTSK